MVTYSVWAFFPNDIRAEMSLLENSLLFIIILSLFIEILLANPKIRLG